MGTNMKFRLYHPYLKDVETEIDVDTIRKFETTKYTLVKLTLVDGTEQMVMMNFKEIDELIDAKGPIV